jgi:predicted TIM-barrel fold metal-dependent hydrolase
VQRSSVRIIDTHIHLFDPTRPQGVPWPTKADGILYQPALPDRYRHIAFPLGIRGAIAIEASPWPEDNQWLLEVAIDNVIIVGVVGNLEPGKHGFQRDLERFGGNPLFLGIRYGNLWGRNLGLQLNNPDFTADLRKLADAGLTLDTADPDPQLISDVVKLTDQVPNLRVVVDHLPQLNPPTERRLIEEYRSNLQELGKRRHIFVKLSEVFRHINGRVPEDLAFYRSVLDDIFDIFGPDRLLYGSDWPNSDLWAPYPNVLKLVHSYFKEKGCVAEEKFFSKNSMAAYRWANRNIE